MTKQSYYEKNKEKISLYEKKRYREQREKFIERSKKASIRGRLAYEMLSKKQKEKIDKQINDLFSEQKQI